MRNRYLWLAVLVGMFLGGCSPDMEKLKKDVDGYWNDTELSSYIDKVEYVAGEKDGSYYPITIHAELNERFASLSQTKQYNTLRNTIQYLMEESILPECGNADCDYENIIATSKGNTYAMPFGSSMYDFTDLPMLINGDEWVTSDSLESNESTETTTSSPSEDEIYEYMKQAYDELTNYGDSYVPEIHDPQVAEMASEKFGISPQQAGDIYIKKEMGQ